MSTDNNRTANSYDVDDLLDKAAAAERDGRTKNARLYMTAALKKDNATSQAVVGA